MTRKTPGKDLRLHVSPGSGQSGYPVAGSRGIQPSPAGVLAWPPWLPSPPVLAEDTEAGC